MDFTKAPASARHARLLNIITDVRNELDFSNFVEENPEAENSIRELLDEAHALIRSLQQSGGQRPDMTMVPE